MTLSTECCFSRVICRDRSRARPCTSTGAPLRPSDSLTGLTATASCRRHWGAVSLGCFRRGGEQQNRASNRVTVYHLSNSRSERVIWLMEELQEPYEIVRFKR